VVLLFTLLHWSTAQEASSSDCVYVYGEWSECADAMQSRTVDCSCNKVGVEDVRCADLVKLPVEQTCEMMYTNCRWKWSRWTLCTTECGGGNTTRVPQCFCDQSMAPVADQLCPAQLYYGREVVSCNQFQCGEVPALNKLYWMAKDETTNWPIENRIFNCSRGRDEEDSPFGQTYSQVLSDPYPADHKHYEWYYLAKEWVAAQLNMANGVIFSPEALQVIQCVGDLLEDCRGFSDDQIPQIYALKEKLGRLNNNIGGLSNVDAQVAMVVGAGNSDPNDAHRSSRLTFILAIAVPVAAIMVIALALGLTVYYVRDKTRTTVEFESEDEESPEVPNENQLNQNVDLDTETEKKDSEGEEQQQLL